MEYFWDELEKYGNAPALIAEQEQICYTQLSQIADRIAEGVPARAFVFLLCRNQIASVAGYIGFLRKRAVVLLLNATIDRALYENLLRVYQPQFIWCPETFSQEAGVYAYGGYKLLATGNGCPQTADTLAVTVTTSGSTGSPKLVRLSYENIQQNTKSIVGFLGVVADDRAITSLPMNYVYGLSVIQSHLMAGASVIMTEKTVFDRKFWEVFRQYGATNFAAVPYVYQMLDKLHFLHMSLPSLRYMTQAGGRLGKELHYKLATELAAQGKKFVVMYGATEATARMAYVPPEKSAEKAGSIGIAIPEGRLELIDTDGTVLTGSGQVGELVYYGKNVMQGYAECRADLCKGDEMHGRLVTGDIAQRDSDGYYTVLGRKSRFLKIYGNRVSLAEIEDLLTVAGYEVACVGEDDRLRIYTTSADCKGIVAYISRKTGLSPTAFQSITLPALPRNTAGKIQYAELK